MPQLDFLIVSSQTYLLPIFIFGYIIYVCYILPWITFYIKLDTKIVNSKFIDIILTGHYDKQYKELHDLNHELLVKLSTFYKFYSKTKKEIDLVMPMLEGYIEKKDVENTSK